MSQRYTPAQKRSYQKYIKSTDEIRFRTRKGRKAEVEQHALSMGETLGQFVDRAITETMENDNFKKKVVEI